MKKRRKKPSAKGLKERRNNFLRRKSTTTPLPETTDTQTDTTDIETTTAKFGRGASRFKTRKSQPSPTDARAAEAPKRNYLRRRPGGDGPSSTPAPGTVSSTLAALAARRPFRVASRRRPFVSTTNTTSSTTSTTTTTTETPEIESDDDFLQDVEENEYIDLDGPGYSQPGYSQPQVPKKPKIQRRPLVSLKEEDQNPSATNEEENKRQSKKYSSTFKKNRLDQALKDRDHDVDYTTERKATTAADDEDISAETAVAIAAHQLLSAPIPVIPIYDQDSKPTRKSSSSPKTITEFEFTSPQYTETYTDSKKIYHDDLSSTTVVPTAFIQSSTGPEYSLSPVNFEAPKIQTTSFAAPKTTYSTAFTTKVPQLLDSEPTITHVGLTGTRYPLAKDPYSTDYTTKYASSAEFTGPTASNSEIPTMITYPEVPTTSFVPKPSFRTTFPVKESKPTGFSLPDFRSRSFTESTFAPITSKPITNSRVSGSTVAPTGRFLGSSPKLIPVPVEDYAFSTDGYTGLSPAEPAYFTREYLLESPVTKAYDDEYQYLSPVTTPQTTTRKIARKKVNRRISTTLRPTTENYVPVVTTAKPRRVSTVKPFEKVQKAAPNRTYRPILNYDYYDDSAEKVAEKYEKGTKVVLHAKGNIECLDIGNFPHPTSCKKFISCARMESGSLLGWEYVCPKGLSFDPVGGICNWSAGLGCAEKDA